MPGLFAQAKPQRVVHLAAQAGVRYSIDHPHAYIDANIQGFLNVLEGCRHQGVEHLAYASSSSVYGGNTSLPFTEHQNLDHPVSLYAATKKANELMAHTYSHLFGVPTTGLRFFTVYGPWGRPDMALFLFAKAMLEGQPIDVYNQGRMVRDFTYIDDIVEGIVRVLDKPATPDSSFDPAHPDPATSNAPYRVFNIGNSQPTPLMDYISALEEALGVEARKNFLPIQPGDVPATSADTSQLEAWVGFKPSTPVREGVRRFAEWYRQHYP
jgi:UDP-glucuronate 4-epimerase